jgi:hypothetical protein
MCCLAPGPGGPFTGRGQPEGLGLPPGRSLFPVPAVGCLVMVSPGRWLPRGFCLLPVRPSRLVEAGPRGRTPVTVTPAARGFAVPPRGPVRLAVAFLAARGFAARGFAVPPRGPVPVPLAVAFLAARGFAVPPRGPVPVPLAVAFLAAWGFAVLPRRRLVAPPLIRVSAAALPVPPGTGWFAPCHRAVIQVTAGRFAVIRLPGGGISYPARVITFCPRPVTTC